MKKTVISIFAIFIALAFVSSTAFPWGSATHAYIDDQIGKKLGKKNKNEIYGGMAPDIFNYAFHLDPFVFTYLHDQLHGIPGDESFMKVWNNASWGFQENLGYGFVSHNDVWGADSTAHRNSLTLNPLEGWVITMAHVLNGALIAEGIDLKNMFGLDDQTVEDICHNLVETAGDILIRRIDRRIGQKVMTSALVRHRSFPALLVSAYAQDLSTYSGMSPEEAVGLITTAEIEFRKIMILYGNALVRSEHKAVQLLAEQLAELAEIYIGDSVSPELVEEVLKAAIYVLEVYSNYYAEISATVNHVVLELEIHGVSY